MENFQISSLQAGQKPMSGASYLMGGGVFKRKYLIIIYSSGSTKKWHFESIRVLISQSPILSKSNGRPEIRGFVMRILDQNLWLRFLCAQSYSKIEDLERKCAFLGCFCQFLTLMILYLENVKANFLS